MLALLATAAVMLGTFIAIELRSPEPLIPPSLFAVPTIALATSGVFVLGMGLFGMFVYLPLYLQAVLGMSAAASGSLFVPMVFAMILSSVVSGQVVSRTGRYKPIAVGGAMCAAIGMALLATMGHDATSGEIVWRLAVCGVGFGAAQPIYTLVVQNAAPRAQLGAATAATQFFRSIGSTIGVALFGTVLLGLYHRGLRAALPAGLPDTLARLFDNPLQLAEARARLAATLTGRADAAAVQDQLLTAVRDSLASGMHVVFVAAAVLMSAGVVINLLIPEVPLRGRAQPRDPAGAPAH